MIAHTVNAQEDAMTDAELSEVVDRLYQLAEVVYACAKIESKRETRPATKTLDFNDDHG